MSWRPRTGTELCRRWEREATYLLQFIFQNIRQPRATESDPCSGNLKGVLTIIVRYREWTSAEPDWWIDIDTIAREPKTFIDPNGGV